MKSAYLCVVFFAFFTGNVWGNHGFSFVTSNRSLAVYCSGADEHVIQSACLMFADDYTQVFDCQTAQVSSMQAADIFIGNLQHEEARQWAQKLNVQTTTLQGEWEAFRLQVVTYKKRAVLVVLGSDARGTAYGVLEMSRIIGVSPWRWWADVCPEKRVECTLSRDYFNEQKPSVQYRGIFINDEDWGLMPWSSYTFEPANVKGQIGSKTYEQVFKLLLRLRANLLWPAMHESTVPFYLVEGNKEMADKYGIVVGTSHCEPLMRNGAGEWDQAKYGDYNFLTNRETIVAYWKERLLEAGRFENFYTIGMRGVHDGKMEGARTLDEQTALMRDAIATQRDLLARYVNTNVESIPQAFMPYKEVLDIYNNNLHLPDDVTLVWCDDNYGYITRLSNEQEQRRSGGSGVYYHLSYWGRPHDYLWLSSTSPAQIYWQMKRAWENGARKLWVANVGDIKPAEYETEFFLDLAWNIDIVSSGTVFNHLETWLKREFGEELSSELLRIKKEYYRLATIRKPEFMGWSRVEEPGAPRGRTPVADTEFNPFMFGDELQRRIHDYNILAKDATECASRLPLHRQEAYFQLIEYPVCAAAAINHKLLYAQKARLAACMGLTQAGEYATLSQSAYRRIVALTHRYNQELAGGKWNRIMDMKPRNLYVFDEVEFPMPILETAEPDRLDVLSTVADSIASVFGSSAEYVAWDAADCLADLHTGAYPIEGLGYSGRAMVLPQGDTLSYSFSVRSEGECLVYVALLPSHPLHGGDLRYEVALDDGEPIVVSYKTVGRSEAWKVDVLRNLSLNVTVHRLRAGEHTLRIKALDEGVVVDRLMVDFDFERKFYEIPAK